jgi:hypothetical protein
MPTQVMDDLKGYTTCTDVEFTMIWYSVFRAPPKASHGNFGCLILP